MKSNVLIKVAISIAVVANGGWLAFASPQSGPASGPAQLVAVSNDLVKAELIELTNKIGKPLEPVALASALEVSRSLPIHAHLAKLLDVLSAAGVEESKRDQVREIGARQIAWATLWKMFLEKHSAVPVPPGAWQNVGNEDLDSIVEQLPEQPQGSEKSSKRDQAKKAVIGLIGAGLCIWQPAICPFVMIVLESLGSGDSLDRDMHLLRGLGKGLSGGGGGDDLPQSLARKIRELDLKGLGEKIIPAVGQIAELKDDTLQKAFAKAIEEANTFKNYVDTLPEWGREAMEAILAGKSLDEVKDHLESFGGEPCFPSAWRSRFEAALRAAALSKPELLSRYWTNKLEKLPTK